MILKREQKNFNKKQQKGPHTSLTMQRTEYSNNFTPKFPRAYNPSLHHKSFDRVLLAANAVAIPTANTHRMPRPTSVTRPLAAMLPPTSKQNTRRKQVNVPGAARGHSVGVPTPNCSSVLAPTAASILRVNSKAQYRSASAPRLRVQNMELARSVETLMERNRALEVALLEIQNQLRSEKLEKQRRKQKKLANKKKVQLSLRPTEDGAPNSQRLPHQGNNNSGNFIVGKSTDPAVTMVGPISMSRFQDPTQLTVPVAIHRASFEPHPNGPILVDGNATRYKANGVGKGGGQRDTSPIYTLAPKHCDGGTDRSRRPPYNLLDVVRGSKKDEDVDAFERMQQAYWEQSRSFLSQLESEILRGSNRVGPL